MLEEKIILEQTVTRANVLLGSELYNKETELKQLVDSFKEDEKEGSLSVTELKLYADDFEYWLKRLYNYNEELLPKKENNKHNLLNEFRNNLETDLLDLNGNAYGLYDEEIDTILDFAVGQCSVILDKIMNKK